VALIALWPYSPLAGVAVLALSHALVLYPTLRPNVQWLGPVVTRFATEKKEVWLTIDDGPTEDTEAVLELFERHQVKATFFVKGQLTAAEPERIRSILHNGHGVANHSHTHPAGSFWAASPRRIASEIDGCAQALEDAGANVFWFRAPAGMKNPFVHPALERRKMRLIGWTARGFDGVAGDPGEIAARIVARLRPGAIVLLHQGRESSLRVLERVILEIRARGYTFTIPRDEQLRE
jgi:peptidoglycan-N-acetylglucosamine deacetylase